MSVWKSRELWTAIAALIGNIITFIVAHYVPDPTTIELIHIIQYGLDGIVAILIGAFTVQDYAAIKYAGMSYKQLTASQPQQDQEAKALEL